MIDFKPSDVDLARSGFPPLVATFDRTEREMAAALILRAMGGEWRAVPWPEIQKAMRADVDACRERKEEDCDPTSWLIASIIKAAVALGIMPDSHGLVSAGFARWEGEPGKSPIEFTDDGKERLRKWVRA